MIKAIFFDSGDVLINNPFEQVLVELSKNLNLKHEDVKKINEEYKSKVMIGEMSVEDINLAIKEKFNLPLTVKEISNIWEKAYSTVRSVNKELCDVAVDLKKRYVVGMISNVYDLMAKIDRERGIFEIFDPCILSCEVGLQKPNKEIFELALKRVNFKPDECVFIDNKAEYLVCPKEFGFHVILFENNKKTLEEFKRLKLT